MKFQLLFFEQAAEEVHENKTNNRSADPGVFSPEDRFERKRDLGFFVIFKARDKRRYFHGPIHVQIPEFTFQETLFGKHDALVINPEQEGSDQDKPDIEGENDNPDPHEIVAEIQRMAHGRVNSPGVESFRNLLIFVSPGSELLAGADGHCPDVLS